MYKLSKKILRSVPIKMKLSISYELGKHPFVNSMNCQIKKIQKENNTQ